MQQTWIAALGQKNGEIRSLPAWLAQVTRNFARLAQRSEARRGRREQVAARPEALASTEELVQKEAVRRHVVEAVLSLREPYRSAVIYRYYEDLSPKEIARKLDIPSATVRSHVHRGLEQMRARLDRLYGDDRSAWCIALAPLAGLTAVPAGTATVAGSAGLLGTVMKVGAAAIVLLGAILIWNFAFGERTEPPIVPSSEPLLAGARTGDDHQLLHDAASEETAGIGPTRIPIPPAARGVLLEGRLLLEEDGSPVSGVMIEPRFSIESGLENRSPTAVTDERGGFSFEIPNPCRLDSIGVRAGSATCETMTFPRKWLDARGNNEITLEASRGGSIEGRVVNLDGSPVPGARVLGWCSWNDLPPDTRETFGEPHRVATADGRGRFLIKHVGMCFLLTAEAPGLICRLLLRGKIEGGERAEGMTLTMASPRSFRGCVLGPDGSPLKGVRVKAKSFLFRPHPGPYPAYPEIYDAGPFCQETKTDDSGCFLFTHLAPPEPRDSSPYEITVNHAHYLRWSKWIQDHGRTLEVRLSAGLILTGSVRDDKGEPVPDAAVHVYNPANRPSVRTDEAGCFRVIGLRPHDASRLTVRAPGLAVREIEPLVIAEDRLNHVDIDLEPGLVIAGRVRDRDGQPVAGAMMTLRARRSDSIATEPLSDWSEIARDAIRRTDDDGRFRFDSLGAGLFTIFVARKEDPSRVLDLPVRSGNEAVEIVIDPVAMRKVVVYGKVTDSRTGLPITRFEITPMRRSFEDRDHFSGRPRSFKTTGGAFEIAGLAPGEMNVTVTAEGYVGGSGPLKYFEIGEHEVCFSLKPERMVQVRLLDSEGVPVAQARLRVTESEDGQPRSRTIASSVPETDEQGEATICGLPAARVTVWVFQKGVPEEIPFSLDLWNEQEGVVEMVLPPSKDYVSMNFDFMGARRVLESGPVDKVDEETRTMMKSLYEAKKIWHLETAVTLTISRPDGTTIKRLCCVPKDGVYVIRDGGPSGPAIATLPFPRIHATIPAEAMKIVAEAPGYRRTSFDYVPESRAKSDETDVDMLIFLQQDSRSGRVTKIAFPA